MLQNKLSVLVARYRSFSSAGKNSFAFTAFFFFQASKRLNKSNLFQYKLKGDLFPVGLIIGCNFFCLQVDEPVM